MILGVVDELAAFGILGQISGFVIKVILSARKAVRCRVDSRIGDVVRLKKRRRVGRVESPVSKPVILESLFPVGRPADLFFR